MWFWIAVLSLTFIVFEESIYYVWNRYIYGRGEPKAEHWRRKFIPVISFLFKKRERDAQQNNHKIS